MSDDVIAVYERGSLTKHQLEKAIDEALIADKNGLAELGITAQDAKTLFIVKEHKSGFVGEAILITIAVGAAGSLVADAASAAAKKLWPLIIKKIRQDKGGDALGAIQPPSPGTENATT